MKSLQKGQKRPFSRANLGSSAASQHLLQRLEVPCKNLTCQKYSNHQGLDIIRFFGSDDKTENWSCFSKRTVKSSSLKNRRFFSQQNRSYILVTKLLSYYVDYIQYNQYNLCIWSLLYPHDIPLYHHFVGLKFNANFWCRYPDYTQLSLGYPNDSSWSPIVSPYGAFQSHGGTPKSSKSLDHDLVLKQPRWLGDPPQLGRCPTGHRFSLGWLCQACLNRFKLHQKVLFQILC